MTTPLAPERVAALIPAYGEEAHIAEVVRGVRERIPNVLVVDDGSIDRTASLAREAGAEVLSHPRNAGKGAAIKSGFNALLPRGYDYILLLDGDGQHLPGEIDRFLAAAAAEPEVMIWIGNRMEAPDAMPWVRRWANRYMSWRISRMCGVKVPDSQCGFRMLHRCVIPRLFCESDAFDYETEMLLVASREQFRIGAVPVTAIYANEVSKIRPVSDGWRFFKLLSRYGRGGFRR